MAICNYCNNVFDWDDLFGCKGCSRSFCIRHVLPEVHNCVKLYNFHRRQKKDPWFGAPKKHPSRSGRSRNWIGIVAVISIVLIGVFFIVPYMDNNNNNSSSSIMPTQSLVEGTDLLRDISPPLEDINTIVQSDEFFDTSTAPTDHNTIEEYFIDVVDMLDIPSDIDVKIFVPVKSDEDILQDGRLLMLDLINEERINRGLSPVSMGNNTAAQDHAENMLETCTSSHWGADGFKPYMRYTLAGGYQYNAENVSGLNYCVGYEYATTTVDESIHDAMRGLMASQGHRDNILDPNHAFVNIGIAHDGRNVKVVQHFEYDSVRFNSLPEINNGIASFSAIILGASEFDDYSVGIYYDPQPYMLTLGQLSRTYCYDFGTPVANIRPSLSPGLEYIDIDQTHYMEKCQDPYDVPASLPAPASPESALLHHKEAQYKQTIKPYPVNWVDADQWTILEDRFDVEFNIRDLTREHGPGVYTFVIGGFIDDDEYVPLSMYSVFHNMPIP